VSQERREVEREAVGDWPQREEEGGDETRMDGPGMVVSAVAERKGGC